MQDLYCQALNYYHQNKYEDAINLLHQCEKSTKVGILINECTNSLKMQYQYIINDAINTRKIDIVGKYIELYKKNIGMDDFISPIFEQYRHGKLKTSYKHKLGKIIIAALAIALFILAMMLDMQTK